MEPDLIEIREHTGDAYLPLVDFDTWRVAVLRYTPMYLTGNITRMQRHDETDEVFVLLSGKCILFVGKGDESVSEIQACDMEPGKVYNVKRGCWHSHTLSEDASVLIVENSDTGPANSPMTDLTTEQRNRLTGLAHSIWGSNPAP